VDRQEEEYKAGRQRDTGRRAGDGRTDTLTDRDRETEDGRMDV
jgi:hypothetical protein